MTTRMISLAILVTACTATRSLTGIAGSGPDDVWVVGASMWSVGDSGTIVHWDDTSWSTVPSGTTLDLEGVWANGADDVWAVGGHATGSDSGTILHFDGTKWSQSYHSDSTLRAVWGTAPDDVWAVGDDLVVLHWDGAKWTSRELSP
jgi:hypothetical protein